MPTVRTCMFFCGITLAYDDVIKWKHFPRYWPFVRGIHRSPVNTPHKGQWRGALMFSLICARINGWVNYREAGDLRRYRAHYDVIVMSASVLLYIKPTQFLNTWKTCSYIRTCFLYSLKQLARFKHNKMDARLSDAKQLADSVFASRYRMIIGWMMVSSPCEIVIETKTMLWPFSLPELYLLHQGISIRWRMRLNLL